MRKGIELFLISIFVIYVLSWFEEYRFRKTIQITSLSSVSRTDVPVEVQIETDSYITGNLMRVDCLDVFFTTVGGTTIDFWLEGLCNSKYTTFWLEIPLLGAFSSIGVYFYYNQPSINYQRGLTWSNQMGFAVNSHDCGNANSDWLNFEWTDMEERYGLGSSTQVLNLGAVGHTHIPGSIETDTPSACDKYTRYISTSKDSTSETHKHFVSFSAETTAGTNDPPSFKERQFCRMSEVTSLTKGIAMFENCDAISGWLEDNDINNAKSFVKVAKKGQALVGGGSTTHSHNLPAITGATASPPLASQPSREGTFGFDNQYYAKKDHTHDNGPLCTIDGGSTLPKFKYLHFQYNVGTGFVSDMITFQVCHDGSSYVSCVDPPLGWELYSPLINRFPRGTNDINEVGDTGGYSQHTHSLTNCRTGVALQYYEDRHDSSSKNYLVCHRDHYHYFSGSVQQNTIDDELPLHGKVRYIKRNSKTTNHIIGSTAEYRCFGYLYSETPNLGCSSHGVCSYHNNCTCYEGYSGTTCENYYCNGIMNDQPSVCSSKGNCTDINTCKCNNGSCGGNCEGYFCYGSSKTDYVCSVDADSSSICSSHGSCDSFKTCSCSTGYYPSGYDNYCESFNCFGIEKGTSEVCNFQNGTCSSYNNCTCSEGYYGLTCELWDCDGILYNQSSVCKSRGNCLKPDTCQCNVEEYCGFSCDDFLCDGFCGDDLENVCSSHGICSSYNNCSCKAGYYPGGASNCSNWKCWNYEFHEKEVCNFQNGTCSSPNNCTCNDGYYGEECFDWKCFNRHYSSDSVCSRHGICVAPDECICSENYTIARDCGVWGCHDKLSNDSSQCTNHGTCYSSDNCSCDSGAFSGITCQMWYCQGIPATSADIVCGGHGSCLDFDTCYCITGYSSSVPGGICNEWYCGDIFVGDNDTSICSGHGECVGSHECECNGGYLGRHCDEFTCTGFPSSDTSSSCNGNGNCIKPDVCSCKFGFSGEDCEINNLIGAVMAPMLSISGLFLICCLGLCFSLICLLICCIILTCIIVTCGLTFSLSFEKLKLKKFGKLKNFDILLKEQEMDEDETVAHLRINKSLFEIPFEEIEVKRLIGEGGSQSMVFLAKWRKEDVAFKVFKTRFLCTSQDLFDDFEREVEILSSLNHPNIVRFFGATMKQPRVGIVMEYCPLGDLVQFLEDYQNSKGGLKYPINEKLRMMREVATSLDYIHSRGIIHRDLKCENILVSITENIKLMDFGVSKMVAESGSTKMTKRIGTAIYMAPEIITNDDYDDKCDSFSFGIMLFVVCTENQNPYGVNNEDRIEFKVASNESYRPNIKELDDAIPDKDVREWVRKVIVRCWNGNPKHRYSSSELTNIFQDYQLKSSRLTQLQESISSRDRTDSIRGLMNNQKDGGLEIEKMKIELEDMKNKNKNLEEMIELSKKESQSKNEKYEIEIMNLKEELRKLSLRKDEVRSVFNKKKDSDMFVKKKTLFVRKEAKIRPPKRKPPTIPTRKPPPSIPPVKNRPRRKDLAGPL